MIEKNLVTRLKSSSARCFSLGPPTVLTIELNSSKAV